MFVFFETIVQSEIWPLGVQSRNQGVAFKNKKQFGSGFIDTNKRMSMWCGSVPSYLSDLGNFGFKQIECD
jgi:hypothetical protein